MSYLEGLPREKRSTLKNNNTSECVFIYRQLRDKIIPINTKRRLIAKVILLIIKEPKIVFRKITKTNLKKFFYYLKITKPSILEKKIDWEISGLSKINKTEEAAEKLDLQHKEDFKSIHYVNGSDLEGVEKLSLNGTVSLKVDNIRVIAFYLPQFHPIPENDLWWGKGFTDWVNVVKAKPNFVDHYQPHLPADFGFYDLRVPEVREQQADLARAHGIYGFCYHHYWFHGHRLLERPFSEVLKSGKPDFPFCLCWANESWTRRWDGAKHKILIAQEHSKNDDIAFIRDIIPALRDDRYIRINGKPLLIVYRINLFPNPKKTAEIWRKECKTVGIGDIYLCAAQSFGITNPKSYGFDAAVEFPPHGLVIPVINQMAQITNPYFKGLIHHYKDAIDFEKGKKCPRYTLFRTVMPSWDNTPRKQNASTIFLNATPPLYKEWLAHAIAYTDKNLTSDERLVFINAWNEWGEGCHLEPDRKYGDSFLKATRNLLRTDDNI